MASSITTAFNFAIVYVVESTMNRRQHPRWFDVICYRRNDVKDDAHWGGEPKHLTTGVRVWMAYFVPRRRPFSRQSPWLIARLYQRSLLMVIKRGRNFGAVSATGLRRRRRGTRHRQEASAVAFHCRNPAVPLLRVSNRSRCLPGVDANHILFSLAPP